MESNYKHKNTYHNSTHAADVLQGAAYLIRNLQTTIMVPHLCIYLSFLSYCINMFLNISLSFLSLTHTETVGSI